MLDCILDVPQRSNDPKAARLGPALGSLFIRTALVRKWRSE
jgi:hypothetical protein